MQCLTPVHVPNNLWGMKDEFKYKEVPCGTCDICNKKKVWQWVYRLQQERRRSDFCDFVTLTYAPHAVPITKDGKESLDKKEFQKFIMKLRTAQAKISNLKFKYYACGEYGSNTYRPHYHIIFFNLHPSINKTLSKYWSVYDPRGQDYISNGFVDSSVVISGAFGYVAGYALKNLKARIEWNENETREKEFITMSKNMGSNYFVNKDGVMTPQAQFIQEKKLNYIPLPDGEKQSIPRYYKEKIFTGQEMVELRIKNRRYADETSMSFEERQERLVAYRQRQRNENPLKRNKI